MIAIHGVWAHVEMELQRLESHPTPHMLANLEDALSQVFAMTQAQVHVITGSLKGSGKTSSKADQNSWEGTIEYGGPSPGFPNNPVNYAIYERARGGTHDFLANVHLANELFEQAIEEAL